MTKIPQTMRAAAIDEFGPPNVLTIHQLPVPALADNEILIKVHTAGVGSWDPAIRGGWWPQGKPKFPVVLGTDGSGIVMALGKRARRLKVGQRVYAYSWMNPKGGFYAEYVAVAAEDVALIPKALDLKRAGAAAATGLTALQGIDHMNLKRGETVIIHGASGGVGSLAFQFAKLRGARILATASGPDGVKLARRLGADAAIDGKQDDPLVAALRFSPEGVDAVFATAGGRPLERCIDALKGGGRLVYPNGVEPAPKKRPGIKIISYDAEAGPRQFTALNRAIDKGKVKVIIGGEFPLENAAKAHQRIEAGHILGKVVLRVR